MRFRSAVNQKLEVLSFPLGRIQMQCVQDFPFVGKLVLTEFQGGRKNDDTWLCAVVSLPTVEGCIAEERLALRRGVGVNPCFLLRFAGGVTEHGQFLL